MENLSKYRVVPINKCIEFEKIDIEVADTQSKIFVVESKSVYGKVLSVNADEKVIKAGDIIQLRDLTYTKTNRGTYIVSSDYIEYLMRK